MSAPFSIRLKAFLIDYIFIFIYLLLLVILSVFLFPSLQELFTGSLILAQFTGFLMVTLPISLYFIICDSVIGGQTFGKKKMGIQVVNKYGNSLSIPHNIFRTILKFSPWELSHYLNYRLVSISDGSMPFNYYMVGILIYALIFTYILTAVFTKKKRALYDIIVKSQVVKIK